MWNNLHRKTLPAQHFPETFTIRPANFIDGVVGCSVGNGGTHAPDSPLVLGKVTGVRGEMPHSRLGNYD